MRTARLSSPETNSHALNGLNAAPGIAQQLHPRLDDEGDIGPEVRRTEDLVVDQTVIAGIRSRVFREAARCAPIELATIDQHTADRLPVTANELGCGMHNDVGAVVERPHQIRRRNRVVEDQRHPGLMGNFGDGLDIEREQIGVAEGFGIDRFGLVGDLLL